MCNYVRLSGGAHGFHYMDYGEAQEAAKELGAVKEYTLHVKRNGFNLKTGRFSTSFYNSNNEEVFTYSHTMDAGQVFDPPRKVAEFYLKDRTL